MKRSLRYTDCCDSIVREIIVSLLCLVTVALFSCAKMTLEAEAPVAAGTLSIVVENFGGETGALRSIAPTQLTPNDLATGYTLKLTGSTGRMTLSERTIALTNGRATLGDIPDGTWHLTLQVYKNTAPTVAILRGDTTVTVNNNLGNEARFTLSPVATGTGTVRLTVSWQVADRGFVQPNATSYPSGLTVSIALYDPVTGQKATSYERLASGGNGAQSDTDAFFRRGFIGTGSGGSTPPLDTTFTYTGGTSGVKTYNVPAGMYMLKFTITGGNLPAGQRLEWSDNLYVEAGRETAGAITIPRLTNEPAEPASLSCRLEAARLDGVIPLAIGWGGCIQRRALRAGGGGVCRRSWSAPH